MLNPSAVARDEVVFIFDGVVNPFGPVRKLLSGEQIRHVPIRNFLEIRIPFKNDETPVMDVFSTLEENVKKVEASATTKDGTTFDLKVSSFSQVDCCTQCLTTCMLNAL